MTRSAPLCRARDTYSELHGFSLGGARHFLYPARAETVSGGDLRRHLYRKSDGARDEAEVMGLFMQGERPFGI